MASIVKRKSKYSVVYNIVDENGVKRQRWETFASQAEAKKRKAQIEYQQSTGTFIAPTAKTIRELLEEYINIYGINTWALSTYESRRALIDNYINPIIGDMPLEQATPRVMDKYYRDLLTVKAKPRPYQTPRNEYLSPRTVKEIHKILRNAFNQAVKWEMISRNPVLNATLPKCETKPREIWTADTLFHALELCDDDNLALALNLAFSCSLRMGEMLALTWDCIDISAESISHDCASIFVNKELQRVQKQSLEMLDGKGVIKVFPSILVSKHTALVLKEPKTKTSIRKVFLPKTVAEMLVAWKMEQDAAIEAIGNEYAAFNLVIATPVGLPCESAQIRKARGLNKMINQPIIERKTPVDFCYVTCNNDTKPIREWMEMNHLKEENISLAKLNHARDAYAVFLYPGGFCKPNGNDVHVNNLPKGLTAVGTLFFNRDAYIIHCKDYKNQKEWEAKRNPVRYESNLGKSYDAKNMSECIRLVRTCTEIAKGETYKVNRKGIDDEFLLRVRAHEFEYEELMDIATGDIEKMERAIEHSTIPEAIDRPLIDSMMLDIRNKLG